MKRTINFSLALFMILVLICGSFISVYAENAENSGTAETAAEVSGTAETAAEVSVAEKADITKVITSVGTTQAFIQEEIPEENIRAILSAGMSAASAINQQPWYFVAITDQDLMKEIAGSGMGGKDMPSFPGGAPEKSGGKTDPESAGSDNSGSAKDPDSGAPAGMPSSFAAKASLGDSPLAILIYKNPGTASPDPDYDCGLATQNMVLAAASLGYGTKIVSSPTISLNGEKHDEICSKLGVDTELQAVGVLLVGKADESPDAVSSPSTREPFENRALIIK